MKHAIVAAAVLGLCGTALAQGASAPTAAGSANEQATSVRCGGVGDADQKRMKAEAAQRGVLVTFATASGAYVADVDYEVRHEGKVVLHGRCGGPLMLLDLARAGPYEIVATSQGRTQRQTVAGGGKPASITMRFPG
ncbi:hypothetical protein H8N03_24665 [Ramlibacter sp. USB13]|uniref:Carboxypeptidase regulatory-like domain-containing protein n=1 Tax=Ramlibacter cellulosilyticus TaxID=2764187 RepID=A0A923MVH4_9BURK|nr:hypothetical protein [Ramlibacter cellulosilyticus]MBC5786155.1 hypothetical protein [Ramlibacter cellulosilyticus]